MKILHISTFDTRGGAARSAYRLHRGLYSMGHDSKMFVYQKSSNDPTVVPFNSGGSLFYKCYRFIKQKIIENDFNKYRKKRTQSFEWFSDDRSKYGNALALQLPFCDIINLHWVAGFIDYKSFFDTIPNNTHLVWRLSDMNPFTGGCHYDEDCGKFNFGCGSCPQLLSSKDNDLSHQIWRRKFTRFNKIETGRLHLVAQSRWMANKIQNSAMLGRFSCTVIPNGIDTSKFSPVEKNKARKELGFPIKARIVLFFADKIHIKRKGFHLLAQALNKIDRNLKPLIVSMGRGDVPAQLRLKHIHMGNINSDSKIVSVLSAADIFVIPSLQDNLPNTVLESMACGTPVVGFDVGGIPDMVINGETGRLARAPNTDDLAAEITNMLKNENALDQMSITCRNMVLKTYDLLKQSQNFLNFYKSIIS